MIFVESSSRTSKISVRYVFSLPIKPPPLYHPAASVINVRYLYRYQKLSSTPS